MPLAVIVVGMPASGKNFARHYAEENGINYLSTGDIVRIECASRGLDMNSENMALVSDDLRSRDSAELTRWLLDRVEGDMPHEPVVILEGMRSWEEIQLARSRMNVEVVAFVVGRETRKERFMARGREDDDPRLFHRRDWREVKYGVGEAIALADHYVLNDSSVEETVENLRRVMERILEKA